MVLKKCSDLKPGMVIAKDVHTKSGNLLLNSGAIVDIEAIVTLNQNSISFVFVKDEVEVAILEKEKKENKKLASEAPSPTKETEDGVAGKDKITREAAKEVKEEGESEEVLASSVQKIPFSDEKESYYDKIQNSEDFKDFRKKFSAGVIKLRGVLNRILHNDLEGDLVTVGRKILEGLKMPEGALPTFDFISNLRRFEDVVYVHSLNVAVLAGMLAKWMEYSDEDVEMVQICGLYHNVGKLTIPVEIISKPEKITKEEYDIIKTYPQAGYEILKKMGANERILNVAYQHKQKCDGSGYPQGFDPKKLDPFSKIITIVDIYDAITSARAYRGMVCPFKVIRMFEEEGMAKYDPKVYKVFLEGIANNFIGNRVKLNDGRIARIIMTNKTYFSMPVVIAGAEYIDLSKRRDLYIDEVI